MKVYPGAKLDDEQTANGKAAGFNLYCYRTNDSREKVIAFYKGQSGLELLFSAEDSAIFGYGGSVKVTVSSPWTDPMTGKTRSDTLIQLLNEGE